MVKRRPKPKLDKGASSNPNDSSSSLSVDDEIYAALASIPQTAPMLLKVCRLCETKDGPFLNIFDADKVTAKRIDEVLPFKVEENDELPHKICFRCSAKVEELYEFILKCIRTQESLQTTVGKKTPLITKSRFRVQWEKQLSKKNISNDDICNALIKKAMEGIKDKPPNSLPVELQPLPVSKVVKNSIEPPVISNRDKGPAALPSKSNITHKSEDNVEPNEAKLKHVKLALEPCDNQIPSTRSSRSNKPEALLDVGEPPRKLKQYSSRKSQSTVEHANNANMIDKSKQNSVHNATSIATDKGKDKSDVTEIEKPKEPPAKVLEPPPPINIMDHVSIIKVNSVGTLFLCKLCNRNFLQKELVLTHGCAKNNVPKNTFLHNQAPPREVPKPSTVKYIQMDTNFKKPVLPSVVPENKVAEKKPPPDTIKVNIPVQPVPKPKPKIGPASKVKNLPPTKSKELTPPPAKPPAQETKTVPAPEVKFPTMPSLNSRYKLVPGPNNTFTLVEDSTQVEDPTPQAVNTPAPTKLKSKKRKTMVGEEDAGNLLRPVADQASTPEVIDLDDVPVQPPPTEQPYPVGLFQTAHISGVFAPSIPKPTFTTPAMKKQSYTIVQTGNPSKLLLSTKPQPVVEEPQRKKSKKSKPDARESNTEPHNVSIVENAHQKDPGFFTFINVDPVLQPSYVLPTNNIIQESQITTSTSASKAVADREKDKYSCNMCQETFSREKKLLAHIQSHFNQMDEEDQLRREKKEPKKKSRKS